MSNPIPNEAAGVETPREAPAAEVAPPTAEDLSFEAHDARLNAELTRYGRKHAGERGFEYGHDESYAPGYHEGGVRFGFFSGHNPKPSTAEPGKSDDKG